MSTPFALELLTHLPASQSKKPQRASLTANAPNFAAQGQIPASALSVSVDGLGALDVSMSRTRAAELHRLSKPARFGKRESTLLDTAVRHTGEVDADAIQLRWLPGTLATLQAEIAEALGVERLEAWLHNLLVYGPGQFFKPHQDTEKRSGMVASLVLVRPCAHIGGELRVQHGKAVRSFSSQQLDGGTDIRWFAFYADCRHEVLPIEAGWRVALTMDLMLPKAAPPLPPARVPAGLKAALTRHFGLEGEPRLVPWVLLLDHEYSQHGLRWHLLKGADRARVGALRSAAEALGLTVHLALAELHQTWTATGDDGYGRRRGPVSEPEPDELIDESFTLDFWVDAQGEPCSQSSLSVKPSDVDSFAATDEQHLVNSEYEGYMGNYGETLDYWYRRAALVIQSPMASERTRFAVDFDAALADLHELAEGRADASVLAMRVDAGRQALANAAARRGRALLKPYADIAVALPSEEAAVQLLTPFSLTSFTVEDAETLADLEKARGGEWMRTVLTAWIDPENADRKAAAAARTWTWSASSDESRASRLWPEAFEAVLRACRSAGVDDAWLAAWLQVSARALHRFDAALAGATPAELQAMRSRHLTSVCELVTAIRAVPGCDKLLHDLLVHIARLSDVYPPESLAPIILAAGPAADQAPAGQTLRSLVKQSLEAALAVPLRAADDHSLRGVRWRCRCRDCEPVVRWAESPSGEPLVLPMAEARRDHIRAKLKAAGAPLSGEVLKQGSPYKLKLTKPGDLRRRDELQRALRSRELKAVIA